MCSCQATALPHGLIGGWISVIPATAILAAGKLLQLSVQYNISQQAFQGTYAADVLITTSGRPVAKVCLIWLQDVQLQTHRLALLACLL